jgi:oxaloacetate decarboxylase alpha subunit
MMNQPKDVVEAFILSAADAGVNVFTNFDAHNDWRNHVNVSEAVHKAGGHYQAALSWAVYHPDPTVYNVQWAIDFFREVSKLGAHSLYVKDPSGVLTPEMAGVLAAEIKAAFPDLPLV